MVAVMAQFSDTATDAMIRIWKLARLACDQGKLDYPSINILHPEHGVIGDDDFLDDDADANTVQRIVDRMPPEIRTCFEAYHLAVIRGDYCRDKPHAWRALALGIQDVRIYYARCHAGFKLVQDHLSLDRV